jgi:cystathionine gamma-synthase/methionine-gamma-lyase
MERQCGNAATLARWLAEHPRISRVYYPGLCDNPETASFFNNELRGGIVAFEIAGAGRDEAFRFMRALRICLPVTTLGDVYTVVLYPPMSSHRGLTPDQLSAAGIGPGLIRLSAGIEDVPDLIDDLEQALERVTGET